MITLKKLSNSFKSIFNQENETKFGA